LTFGAERKTTEKELVKFLNTNPVD
jgi:hypothetical protein